ncbi:MAG: PilN domain-containing protein, partial [Nitrospinales bacterium]
AERYFLAEINRFLLRHNEFPQNFVISLPRSYISFKSFDLPAPDRKSVDSMVEFEMEKHFSTSVDDLCFSYLISEISKTDFHVVLSAVQKDITHYYLELIQRLSLKPSTIDVSTFSNLSMIYTNGQKPENLIAVIDLCSTSFEITLLKNGIIEITKNIHLDDTEFSHHYFKEDIPREFYEKYANPMAQKIIDETLVALSSCNKLTPEDSVEQIHLAGGGPYAESLARQLEQQAKVPVLLVTSENTPNLKPVDDFEPTFLVTSLSLGLREFKSNGSEINLLPPELRPKKKKVSIKTTLGLSLAVVLLLIAWFSNKIIYNNTTLASLENQLQEIKTQVGDLEKIDVEFENLKNFINIFKQIDQQAPFKLPLLQELSRVLPKDTWLTNISITKNKIELKGFSASASKLVPLLENSPYFKDTGFKGTIVNQEEGEKFTIRSTLQVSK